MNARHPYNFIPFDRTVEDRKEKWPDSGPTGHQRIDPGLSSGTMECVLETKTPLAIMRHFIRDKDPFLPGSTIKGLVRSTAQMMGAGCADHFLFDENDRKTNLSGLRTCDHTATCLVCRVFGYSPSGVSDFGWAGKVRFFDSAPPENWTPARWADPDPLPPGNARLHRPGGLHRGFYYRKEATGQVTDDPLGWKVYLHSKSPTPTYPQFCPPSVVRVGERFRFHVEFENLTPEEFWVFHFALTLTHDCGRHEKVDLCHKLGYGKALGLGSCKIIANISALPTRRYFGEAPPAFGFPSCALDRYLDGEAVKAMKRRLSFAKAPDCVRFPDGGWFHAPANRTATIQDWESYLQTNPPHLPAAFELPPVPIHVFPDRVEVVITRNRAGVIKGEANIDGKRYSCTVTGSVSFLKAEERIWVKVMAVDKEKYTFAARYPK